MASKESPERNATDSPQVKVNGHQSSGCSSLEGNSIGAELNGNHSSASSGTGTGENGDNARKGVCKWFNVLKGFGFLTPDDGGEEVFVHQSVLKMPGFRSLDAGEAVEFEAKRTERGWEATNVTGPSDSNCKGSRVHPLGKKRWQKIRCFNCGRYGNHTAGKCPLGPMDKVCYNCHARDHLVANCPIKQASPQTTQPKMTEAK